jgi:hypothetical protein
VVGGIRLGDLAGLEESIGEEREMKVEWARGVLRCNDGRWGCIANRWEGWTRRDFGLLKWA